METMIKTTRVAPGYYTATANGVTYEISGARGDDGAMSWYWNVEGANAEDNYNTKRECLAALTDWVANLPVVESRGAMMLRMKRAVDARCAADGITVGR